MTDHLILRPSGEFAGPVDEHTLVLGIETSCDETAAALVLGGYDVASSVVSTQRNDNLGLPIPVGLAATKLTV